MREAEHENPPCEEKHTDEERSVMLNKVRRTLQNIDTEKVNGLDSIPETNSPRTGQGIPVMV